MYPVICSNLKNILLPANGGDVGFDLVSSSDPLIVGERVSEDPNLYESIDYIEYEVDLRIEPLDQMFSFLMPRSSLSKYDLQMCNSVGVIDQGYRGKIKVRFNYLAQPKSLELCRYIKPKEPEYIYENFVTSVDLNRIYKRGDKIAQLVFFPILIPKLMEGVVSESDRGEGGFGSTGQ